MFKIQKILRHSFCSLQVSTPKLDYYNLNVEKYKDLDQPIKAQDPYSFVQREPFPRLRIMKICQILLHELVKFPEDYLARIYYEEKSKWIMEQVDSNKNIPELEVILGDEVEVVIEELNNEKLFLDHLFTIKPWMDEDSQLSDEMLFMKTEFMSQSQFLRFYETLNADQKALWLEGRNKVLKRSD